MSTTDIFVTIKHKTESAVLVDNGTTEQWVPLVAVETDIEDVSPGMSLTIEVQEDIAFQKGLI